MEDTMTDKQRHFVHNEAADAVWTQGMRKIFEYRDLGIKSGTDDDYVAHLIRANGNEEQDQIHAWHIHECQFQMIYILKGWATFEYEGIGVRTLRKGDCINQPPLIKHQSLSDQIENLLSSSSGDCPQEATSLPSACPAAASLRIPKANW